jgi:hypothetical protein
MPSQGPDSTQGTQDVPGVSDKPVRPSDLPSPCSPQDG